MLQLTIHDFTEITMLRKNYFWLIFMLGLFSAPAYAYLDPGSGSVFLQTLLAGTAGIAAIMKLYWQQLKSWFTHIFKRKSTVQNQSSSYHEDH